MWECADGRRGCGAGRWHLAVGLNVLRTRIINMNWTTNWSFSRIVCLHGRRRSRRRARQQQLQHVAGGGARLTAEECPLSRMNRSGSNLPLERKHLEARSSCGSDDVCRPVRPARTSVAPCSLAPAGQVPLAVVAFSRNTDKSSRGTNTAPPRHGQVLTNRRERVVATRSPDPLSAPLQPLSQFVPACRLRIFQTSPRVHRSIARL